MNFVPAQVVQQNSSNGTSVLVDLLPSFVDNDVEALINLDNSLFLEFGHHDCSFNIFARLVLRLLEVFGKLLDFPDLIPDISSLLGLGQVVCLLLCFVPAPLSVAE